MKDRHEQQEAFTSRISIDVTTEEHQKLEAVAALQGETIKEFVLKRTLGALEDDEVAAVRELEAILEKRIQSARDGNISKRTVDEIFEAAYRKPDTDPVNG